MVLAAATLWGSSGLFINLIAETGLTGSQITALRLVMVPIMVLVFLLITDRSKLRIQRKDLGWMVLNGIIGIFVFNLCLFGAVSGAGIFGAQFYGKNDQQGLKFSLRFKLVLCLLLTAAGVGLFLLSGDRMISSYLAGEGAAEEIKTAFDSAKLYLLIMLIGFVPFAVTQSYSSTLRETGETVLPMKAGMIAVTVNLLFNYILKFL